MAALKKGSQAAKDFMSRIRAIKQTGTSNKKIDATKQALPVGKRKSQYGGGTYYEYRANKSDKGRLLGTSNICGLPSYKDPDAAREIELYAENDNDLYFSSRKPILINLGKKHKKGTYSVILAAKLYRYYIDAALKKYNKDFGSRNSNWFDLLSTGDRQLLAENLARETKQEFDLGNYQD